MAALDTELDIAVICKDWNNLVKLSSCPASHLA